MAVVDSMSLPLSITGWRKAVRRAALGTLLLLVSAAPGWSPPEARESHPDSAVLPKPGTTRVRRAGRRPLGRQKHIITDQDILDQAQAAYIRGERQHAIDLATSIADKGGELATPAWRFIGLAACSVRANRLASRALGNLATAEDQQALVRACQSNGLILLNNQFVEH